MPTLQFNLTNNTGKPLSNGVISWSPGMGAPAPALPGAIPAGGHVQFSFTFTPTSALVSIVYQWPNDDIFAMSYVDVGQGMNLPYHYEITPSGHTLKVLPSGTRAGDIILDVTFN